MNKRNIIGSTVLIVGLLAAGTSFAADENSTAPAPVKTQEQNAEKQQTLTQQRNQIRTQEGNGEQRKEMHREQVRSGDQGLASVNKNLENNPDNKGLQTAAEQLKQNQLKQAEQTKLRSGKQEKHMEQHMEKRTERHEAMGRPAKIERPGK